MNEEWLVLPGIILVFILSDILRKEGYGGFTFNEDSLKEMENLTGCIEDEKPNLSTTLGTEVAMKMEVAEGNAVLPEKGRSQSGGCGSGCGGGCGSGCGGCGGGSGCGKMVKSGGCGGCGSGCGNRIKSGGCGGCGGCGNGGCGGCGSGGCGNRIKSGGCGGCGGCGASGIRFGTGDSASESANGTSAANPCIGEHSREAPPTHMNPTVVA